MRRVVTTGIAAVVTGVAVFTLARRGEHLRAAAVAATAYCLGVLAARI